MRELQTMINTDFERVRRAMFRLGEGDRAPLFEISIDKSIKSAFLGRPMKNIRDELEFWQTAGYDFVTIRSGVRSVVRGLHPDIIEWKKAKYSLDPQVISGWVDGENGLIKTRNDFVEFPWPKPEKLGGYNDYSDLETHLAEIETQLSSDMKVIPQLGYLFMGAWQLMGFENFCIYLSDDRQLIQDVINRLAENQLCVLEILLQHECVGAIFMPDDLCYNSGPIVSPKVYKEFIYPWYRKIIDRCHAKNIPIGLHSDGDLTLLLPDLVDCGFDCIHPFEPPMNDIVAVKHAWGDRIAVAGNIDLKGALSSGSPEDVVEEVKEKASKLAPNGGWLLGSSNSIPDFVPIENFRAMLSSGMTYGRANISN